MLRTSIVISLATALIAAVGCSEGSGSGTGETNNETEETEETERTETEVTDESEAGTEVMETDVVEEPEGPVVVVAVEARAEEAPDRGVPAIDPDSDIPLEPLQFNDSATIELTEDDGYPDPPALRIDAPFDEYNQVVELEWSVMADLAGGTLVLPIKVVSNEGDPECPKGLQFYVKTGSAYVWGEVGWQNLPEPGGWTEIRFPVDLAESPEDVADQFDPSAVNTVGVTIHAGDCGGDAANRSIKPGTAVVLLDDIIVEGVDADNVSGPGGSDASDGPDGEALVPVAESTPSVPEREVPDVPDGGVPTSPLQFNASSTIETIDSDGYPDPPALSIDAPFDNYNQVVEVEWPVMEDLTGQVLILPVKVVSNQGDPECPKGMQFYVKAGPSFVWGEVGWQNLPDPGGWTEIRFPVDQAESPEDVADQFDPSAVSSIGVTVHTGDCGGDAANRELRPGQVVVLLDDIYVTPAE